MAGAGDHRAVLLSGRGQLRGLAVRCPRSRRPHGPVAGAIGLRVRIDHATRPLLPTEAANSLFNLSVKDTATGQIEVFRNVSVTAGHSRGGSTLCSIMNLRSFASIHGALLPVPGRSPQLSSLPAPGSFQRRGGDELHQQSPITEQAHAAVPMVYRCDAEESPIRAWKPTKPGIFALLNADLFNLLCIPPHKLQFRSRSDAHGRYCGEAGSSTRLAFLLFCSSRLS